MIIVGLLALGLAAPEPPLALTLIFTCPIWLIVVARKSQVRQPNVPPAERRIGDVQSEASIRPHVKSSARR
jgi:hypothetical protein